MVLTDDQRALQETARRFARERLLPDYQKREKIGVLDRGLIREMGKLGFLGMDLPEELGGMGCDSVTTGLVAEELAYGDFNVSAVPVGISLNGAILMRHAQPEVVKRMGAAHDGRRRGRGDLPDRAARRLRRQQPAVAARAGMATTTSSTARRPRSPSPTVPTRI